MKYFYPSSLFSFFLFFSIVSSAQIADSIILRAYNDYTTSNINEDAVIIYNDIVVRCVPNNDVKNIYKETSHHVIMKILTEQAQDEANVKLYDRPFTVNYGRYLQMRRNEFSRIKGTTYNIRNGKVTRTDLDENSILKRQIVNGVTEISFTLKNVSPGSIIEYSYEKIEPIDLLLGEWQFQNKYPTVLSEYTLLYPKGLDIARTLKANIPFKSYASIAEARKDNAQAYYVKEQFEKNVVSEKWGRINVPAYRIEPVISNISNHIEKANFQIREFDLPGFRNLELFNSWEKFTYQLLSEDFYGKHLNKKNSFLNDKVAELIKNKKSNKEKAFSIYSYCRSAFTCDDTRGTEVQNYLEGVFNNKRGHLASINMILVLMLRKAGLEAHPVVLSTIDNGRIDSTYPFLEYFNYLVCAYKENNKYVFLDASSKFNAFETLPVYCYNGYARILSEKGGEPMILDSKQLKEKNAAIAVVNKFTSNTVEIDVTRQYSLHRSSEIRQYIDKHKESFNVYFEKLITGDGLMDNVSIHNIQAFNVDNVDTSIILKYRYKSRTDEDVDVYYFHTDIFKCISGLPFTDELRTLPIEFPYKEDNNYILQMKVPDNITIEEVPKPTF